MITREEAKDMIKVSAEYNSFYNYCETDTNAYEIIDKLFDQQDPLQQHIKSLEAQLARLNSNIEAQEIMIADYKKRIVELEALKSCEGCMYLDYKGLIARCDFCTRGGLKKDHYKANDT